MSFRELVILLLGLAIVAVILRGLYVAIQARKGQIKLAIDKNIPQDVDLDALEMAELPGGGARTVQRNEEAESYDENADPIERANARAESIALNRDAESVPVLMDSVTLGQSELDLDDEESSGDDMESFDEAEFNGELIEDETTEADFSADESHYSADSEPFEDDFAEEVSGGPIEESYSDSEGVEQEVEYEQTGHGGAEADDILLDYHTELHTENRVEQDNSTTELDGLASVQPDYPDDYSDEGDQDSFEEESIEEEPVFTQDDERAEPTFDSAMEGDIDDFSMTAGERIGYQSNTPSQTSIPAFDDEAEPDIPVKRTSLFTALRNKLARKIAAEPQDEIEDEDFDDSEFGQEEIADEFTESQDDVFINDEDDEYLEQQGGEAEGEEFEDELISRESDAAQLSPAAPTDIRQHQGSSQPTEIREQTGSSQPSEVLVLNVMAHEGREFHGDELMHAVITGGLKFGEMNIFHLRYGDDSKGPVIFSLANVLNPGTFDLNNMSDFSTIGVSLFLALPVAGNNYDAFEQMLETAQELCASLDGELKDDHRNVMTAQTIEHYRQRVRDFELRQLKAAGSRG